MNYPDKYEYVICKVDRIMPYGVNVILEEYEGIIGYVPLSQVAPRWIKNIRNFVKVGQIKVGKVTHINTEKQQVDISFAVVTDTQENQKLNEWRQTKRVQQLINLLAKDINKDPDALWDSIVNPILEKYDSVYDAFKDMIIYGQEYVTIIPKELRAPLYNILKNNIVIHERELSEEIKISTNDPNGIDKIKTLFSGIPEDKELETNITYIGNGKYLIKLKAIDYKKIEKYLTKINDYLNKEGKKFDVFEIKRNTKAN